MLGEFVPRFDIREIAASLTGNHDLPAGTGHFLQDEDGRTALGSPIGCHQSGRSAADYDDIEISRQIRCFFKKILIFAVPIPLRLVKPL